MPATLIKMVGRDACTVRPIHVPCGPLAAPPTTVIYTDRFTQDGE